MKQKVIAIVGPTAVGKSDLGIALAKRLNGEIISGDSMQIYKGMDIGTAKITKDGQQGVKHYMIDIKEPWESFSVADFQELVRKYIHVIAQKGKVPILVGGSGLYIQAALFDYHFSEQKRDTTFTEKMEEQIEKKGIAPFYQKLMAIDPQQADKIHPNNHRRVIRALEIYETTGMTMSQYQQSQRHQALYDVHWVGLEMQRQVLYHRINLRVDQMIARGLVNEVKQLYDQGLEDCQSMKGIGYKEFIPYFRGEISFEKALDLLKRNSRRYAKRQYTWFKNKLDIPWYCIDPHAVPQSFSIIFADLAGIFLKK